MSQVTCSFCLEAIDRNHLFRHLKRNHSLSIVKRQANALTDYNKENHHTVALCKLPVVPFVEIAVCLCCGKGGSTVGTTYKTITAQEFYDSHTECRSKWSTVAWLFGQGKKPEQKPRGPKGTGTKSKVAFDLPTIPISQPGIRQAILDQFGDYFRNHDYETDSEDEEYDQQAYRDDRDSFAAMDVCEMIRYVATSTEKTIKRLQSQVKSKQACVSCKSLESDYSKQEKDLYEMKQEKCKLESRNEELVRRNEELVRRIEELEE